MDKRASLKAQLMAQLEAELEKALSVADELETMSMERIEEATLKMGVAVRQQVGQALTNLGSEQLWPEVLCPSCGAVMRYKGRKRRYVRSRSGEMLLERAYYYCSGCGRGHFPPR